MGKLDFASDEKDENIFQLNKGDGAAYLVFYIFFPVLITYFSLKTFPQNREAGIYCYVTILVSALNCIYDAANRWVNNRKNRKNGKLFIMISCTAIVAGYSIVVIVGALATQNALLRCDWLLIVYLVSAIVAIIDVLACFSADVAWNSLFVSKGGDS